MSYLKIKAGAIVSKQVIISAAVVNAANKLCLVKDMVITSGNDSDHMIGSKHYSDEALDFRTNTLTKPQIQALAAEARTRLGSKYQVIVEPDHLHVEFDPS